MSASSKLYESQRYGLKNNINLKLELRGMRGSVSQSRSLYEADMAAIYAYMYKNYEYGVVTEAGNGMTCVHGAWAQYLWSREHWGVWGSVDGVSGSSHVAFYPEIGGNPYSRRSDFNAEGHSEKVGSKAYNNRLALLEGIVEDLKAAGK